MEDGQEYKADEIAKIVGLKSSRTRELLKILVDDDKLGIVGNKKTGVILLKNNFSQANTSANIRKNQQ